MYLGDVKCNREFKSGGGGEGRNLILFIIMAIPFSRIAQPFKSNLEMELRFSSARKIFPFKSYRRYNIQKISVNTFVTRLLPLFLTFFELFRPFSKSGFSIYSRSVLYNIVKFIISS